MGAVKIAKEVIEIEIAGLVYMSSRLGDDFSQAVNAIISAKGRTIICGMGKSGLIGKKIVASLASTGTPSFFMHPGEAFHGDLGMVTSEDVFIAISNSGETDEVLKLLPFLRDNGNYIIGITGNMNSTLAKNSHCHLDVAVPKEACPLQLAPTSSTTATLVMGDALTVALMKQRNFQPESFARFHPGGSLGKRLLSKVRDEMISVNLPVITSDSSAQQLIHAMTKGMLGVAIIMDHKLLKGIVTDGDLRRAIEIHGKDIFDKNIIEISSQNTVTISQDSSMIIATELMEEKKINLLIALDNNIVVGVLKK
jgi:arabinose-5-phosphate isomerase